MSLFDEIRDAAAAVAAGAAHVRIDAERLAALADEIAPALADRASDDPAHLRLASEEQTLAFVLTLDAVNFGSGWFPALRKRRGRSGYFTVSLALREHFEAHGTFDARALGRLGAADVAALLGQDAGDRDAAELMDLYARALRDLGDWLLSSHGGSFASCVRAADQSAERLARSLAEMPFYRDVAHYGGRAVPFYKRAQITVADLASAFEGDGPGRFRDLDELTIFADNLVPHVLRCEGVLRYGDDLAQRIDAGSLIEWGSPEEVEIRAVALHAVERMAGRLAGAGRPGASAWRLDQVLWTRGQRSDMKARPRHRTRCTYY